MSTHRPGFLPYMLAFTGLLSLNSTVLTYTQRQPRLVRTLYFRAPPAEITSHSARLFGTWNLLSTVVRFYAAYNITNPAAYHLGLWTYGIALAHFGIETLVFGTLGGLQLYVTEIAPVVAVTWMAAQWNYYLS